MAFLDFVEVLKTCRYGFAEITGIVADFYNKLCLDAHITEITDGIWSYLSNAKAALPFVLLAVYLFIALAGKRAFAVIRFVWFFILGFFLGVYSLSPIMLDVMPELPPWVIGIVTGIVAAVLAKFIYYVVIAVATAYSAYVVCYCGMIPWAGDFIKENWIVGLAAALVCAVALFFVLKYVEMAGTSMLGAYGVVTVVRGWWDFTAYPGLLGKEWIVILCATLVLAVCAFIFQFKTRKRYE